MSEPRLTLRLPDGALRTVGVEAVVGRSRAATVVIADPRVSTVHAELSWRDGRFVALARGGRLTVDGQAAREVPLGIGSRILLCPGVALEVVDIEAAEVEGVPPTAGRAALTLSAGPDRVEIRAGAQAAPVLVLAGLPARLLGHLLAAGGPVPWDEAAATLWPDEAALRTRRAPLRADGWTAIDERRHRNRFDQVLAALRTQLEQVRPGRWVTLRQGVLAVELGTGDRCEGLTAPGGPDGPPR